MRKLTALTLTAMLMLNGTQAFAQNGAICYYVSPDGNDMNQGTEAEPFKTIAKANEVVLSQEGTDFEIKIKSGDYNLSESIVLSQIKNKKIKYTGTGAQKPTISGKNVVDASEFTDVTDPEILKLLPESSKAFVKCVDLSAYEDLGNAQIIGSYNTPVAIEPYGDGVSMNIAQYPNKNSGYCYVVEGSDNGTVIKYKDYNKKNFTDIGNIYVYGGINHYWAARSLKPLTVDSVNGTMTFDNVKANRYREFIFYNTLEDLDAKGEYFIDRTNKKLYFYPYDNMKKMQISKLGTPLLKIDNSSALTFENIGFEYGSDDAINITDSNNINIVNCDFKNLGETAIEIKGGNDITVKGCNITQTGHGGIFIDSGDRKTLTHANVVVDGCDIYDTSRRTISESSCVTVQGCGNIIKNSKFHNMPHTGISVSGNEHTIQNNEVYDVCNMNYDAGALYMHGDWAYCGNVIKNNYFHHINGRKNSGGVRCVYFDNIVSGNLVENNIFAYSDQAVFVHGGQNTVIRNNLFFDCVTSAVVEEVSGFKTIDMKPYISRLSTVPFAKDPWNKKYPYLKDIYTKYMHNDEEYKYPRNNEVYNNTVYNSEGVYVDPDFALNHGSVMKDNVLKNVVLYK